MTLTEIKYKIVIMYLYNHRDHERLRPRAQEDGLHLCSLSSHVHSVHGIANIYRDISLRV